MTELRRSSPRGRPLLAACMFVIVAVILIMMRQSAQQRAETAAQNVRIQHEQFVAAQQAEAERQRAKALADQLEQEAIQKREARQHSISLIEDRIAGLQETLDSVTVESTTLDANIKQYMIDHREAVIALAAGAAGGAVALDSSNKYSDDAKALGGITAVVALFWAANHADEVNQVAADLTAAGTRRSDYTSQIADLNDKIRTAQANIAALNSQ